MRPVGYYVGGSPDEIGRCALCVACAGPDAENDPGAHAIMSWDEADCPTHCEECGDVIPHSLTDEGYRYVRAAIQDHGLHGTGDGFILGQWWAAYIELEA